MEVFLKPRNQILLAASCLPFVPAISYLIPRTTYQCFKAISHGHFPDFIKAMASALDLLPGSSLSASRSDLKLWPGSGRSNQERAPIPLWPEKCLKPPDFYKIPLEILGFRIHPPNITVIKIRLRQIIKVSKRFLVSDL